MMADLLGEDRTDLVMDLARVMPSEVLPWVLVEEEEEEEKVVVVVVVVVVEQ